LRQFGKRDPHIVQVRNLGIDQRQFVRGQEARVGTTVRAIEAQQTLDFLQGESQQLCALDELQAIDIVSSISPVAANWLVRLRQQAAALVIAYRFHTYTRGLRHLTNCQHDYSRDRLACAR